MGGIIPAHVDRTRQRRSFPYVFIGEDSDYARVPLPCGKIREQAKAQLHLASRSYPNQPRPTAYRSAVAIKDLYKSWASSKFLNQLTAFAQELGHLSPKLFLLMRIVAVFKRILVTLRRPGPLAAMHPATDIAHYCRRSTQGASAGLRTASSSGFHRPNIAHMRLSHDCSLRLV
jgi:hypothetical protein